MGLCVKSSKKDPPEMGLGKKAAIGVAAVGAAVYVGNEYRRSRKEERRRGYY